MRRLVLWLLGLSLVGLVVGMPGVAWCGEQGAAEVAEPVASGDEVEQDFVDGEEWLAESLAQWPWLERESALQIVCAVLQSPLASDLESLLPDDLTEKSCCVLVAQRMPEGAATVQRRSGSRTSGVTSREAARAGRVQKKYVPELNRLRAEIKVAQVRVARLLLERNPDRHMIKAMVEKICALRRRQQLVLLEQLFETLDSLPADRRAEYLQPIVERFMR